MLRNCCLSCSAGDCVVPSLGGATSSSDGLMTRGDSCRNGGLIAPYPPMLADSNGLPSPIVGPLNEYDWWWLGMMFAGAPRPGRLAADVMGDGGEKLTSLMSMARSGFPTSAYKSSSKQTRDRTARGLLP